MEESDTLCLCCSGLLYKECCKPFHKGKLPKTPLQLMRSRFVAYALNLPEYIIATTHPENTQYSENIEEWKQSISEFSTSSSFNQLEILEFTEQGDRATVTFTASMMQGDRDCSFTEKSVFECCEGHWLYKSGQVQFL